MLAHHILVGRIMSHLSLRCFLQIQELLDAIVSGAISARIAAEAVHPLYTLFVPVNGSICTCPGIRIGPEFGKLHVDDTLCRIVLPSQTE